MTIIFADVLAAQTEAFKKALSAGDKAEKAKMVAVYKTAEAMEKGDFVGFKTADGKAIPSKDPLYIFGQLLDYCQRFVDAGKKDLLLKELRNNKGELIGLRKAKDVLPALGRDNGLAQVFPKRNTSASHKAKTEGKTEKVTAEKVTTINREYLMALTLGDLHNLADIIEAVIEEKTASRKKPTARKAA